MRNSSCRLKKANPVHRSSLYQGPTRDLMYQKTRLQVKSLPGPTRFCFSCVSEMKYNSIEAESAWDAMNMRADVMPPAGLCIACLRFSCFR